MPLPFTLRLAGKFHSVTFLLSVICNVLYAQAPFITTWKTDNPGVSGNNQITIPTTGTGYNYDVNWQRVDDAAVSGSLNDQTADVTITFPSAGIYRIEIRGDFPRIYFNNEGDRRKILTVESWGDIAWTSMEEAFWGCTHLTVPAGDAPDLSAVTNMRFMFKDADSFNQYIDSWDVGNVTNMQELFGGADAFNQSIANWDIGNVTNMTGMFSFSGLSTSKYERTLEGWTIQTVQPNVTVGAEGLFYCNGEARAYLQAPPRNWTFVDSQFCPFITTWKTDNIGSSGTNQITIPTFGGGYNYNVHWESESDPIVSGVLKGLTGNVTVTFPSAGTYRVEITGDFHHIFFAGVNDCRKILTVEQWGDITWSSMHRAFAACFNLTIPATDAPDLQNVIDMSYMFNGALIFNQDISGWDVSNVTDMSSMFLDALSFNQPLGDWNVSNVTNMSRMFGTATVFNQPIGQWNVSNVTNMSEMFWQANAFNQDITTWDVSNVINMAGTFSNTSSFNQDIGGWDVSKVTDMQRMFAVSSFNRDISGWDVGSVKLMSGMFMGSAFTGNISNWDVSSVTSMDFMFLGSLFNGDISGWDVSSVENMEGMFYESLFAGDISGWDVSAVAAMTYMFSGAKFDGDLGGWDISSVIDMSEMFNNSGMSAQNYERTLAGWSTLDFSGAGELQIPEGISLGAATMVYCDDTGRNILTGTFGWSIEGDMRKCPLILAAIEDAAIYETETVFFTATILHDLFTGVQFSLDTISVKKGMTINTSSGEFNWTPGSDQSGIHTVTITVTAEELKDEVTFTITVRDVPVILINNGLQLIQGESATITNTMLLVEDEDTAVEEIVFTVTTPPSNGVLFRNGVILSQGSTFTQADVNQNVISYQHDGFNAAEDKFSFSISDGQKGTTSPVDFQIVVDIVTAAETEQSREISLYPVPAQKEVTISMINSYDGNVSFQIVDMTGKELKTYRTVKQTGELIYPVDISNIPCGVAFVQVRAGRSFYMLKVIKE